MGGRVGQIMYLPREPAVFQSGRASIDAKSAAKFALHPFFLQLLAKQAVGLSRQMTTNRTNRTNKPPAESHHL